MLFISVSITSRRYCSSSSPRVGRDLGRSYYPGLTKMPLLDEWSEVGSFNAILCVLPDVLLVVVLRKLLMK